MSELDRPEDDAAEAHALRERLRREREQEADDRLRAVRDRFMRRGPAKYRVLDDEWWQR